MPDYRIVFARSARKELENLDRGLGLGILERIEALGKDPRPAGVRKLRGAVDLWRLRVGDYRVVYAVDDSEKTVMWWSFGIGRRLTGDVAVQLGAAADHATP